MALAMKPFVRFTALVMAMLFLFGAGLAWFDVLTHENILTNPELKPAGGWLLTGVMFGAMALRGWRKRSGRTAPSDQAGISQMRD
jgi:hypothetical protein